MCHILFTSCCLLAMFVILIFIVFSLFCRNKRRNLVFLSVVCPSICPASFLHISLWLIIDGHDFTPLCTWSPPHLIGFTGRNSAVLLASVVLTSSFQCCWLPALVVIMHQPNQPIPASCPDCPPQLLCSKTLEAQYMIFSSLKLRKNKFCWVQNSSRYYI